MKKGMPMHKGKSSKGVMPMPGGGGKAPNKPMLHVMGKQKK